MRLSTPLGCCFAHSEKRMCADIPNMVYLVKGMMRVYHGRCIADGIDARDHGAMDESETLGQRIVRAYVGAEMTRAEFSRRLNTVYHQVLRWEAGATPELATLKRIAELTNVSLEWLLEGESRTDRDDSKGYASVEKYIAEMTERGTPVDPEHALDLRSWRRSRGEPEREEIVGYHRGMIAADARKAFERPIVETKIDEARGQKKITPIRKKKS